MGAFHSGHNGAMVETSSDPPPTPQSVGQQLNCLQGAISRVPGRRLALVSPQASLGGAWCVQRPWRSEENLPEKLCWATQLMPFGGTLGRTTESTPSFMAAEEFVPGPRCQWSQKADCDSWRAGSACVHMWGKQLQMPGRHYLHVFMNSVRPEVRVHESLCKQSDILLPIKYLGTIYKLQPFGQSTRVIRCYQGAESMLEAAFSPPDQ
ncbi:hypothetical protein E2320_012392 [Naja naja]|nr:hypothetical protein E2320_012392 [Naja naja]